MLEGVRSVHEIASLSRSYDLTVNCVSQKALVDVQSKLVSLFTNALHFCDTPIFARLIELPQVVRLAKVGKLFSLEDWPSMPNLQPMLSLYASQRSGCQFRFEHIGIVTHFLSVARTAAGFGERGVARRRARITTVRHAKSNSVCVHSDPKDYTKSRIFITDEMRAIEDSFEVRHRREANGDRVSNKTVYRHVERDRLYYCIGDECFRRVEIPEAIIALFLDRGTRNAVHELDKCVALMDMFRGALNGKIKAYGYLESTKDAVAARLLRSVLGISSIGYRSGNRGVPSE